MLQIVDEVGFPGTHFWMRTQIGPENNIPLALAVLLSDLKCLEVAEMKRCEGAVVGKHAISERCVV